jgi:ATP-dependent exoDNAse (exonuclease V) beta subunit
MPLEWSTYAASESTHLHAEIFRKQYVAGTRPGCCLIASVFTTKDGTANGGWHELAPDVTTFDDLPSLPAAPEPAPQPNELPADDVIAAEMAASTDAAQAIYLPTYGTVTPRDFLTEPAERLRHSGDGLGEAWGTVIHLLLESALRNEQSPQPAFDLLALAASALAESELSESGMDLAMLAARAVELVDEVRHSALWKRIKDGSECFMEVPFSICVDAAEVGLDVPVDYGPTRNAFDPTAASEEHSPPSRPPVLIRGQIDLAFRDVSASPIDTKTDWVIVDWKTSAVIDADRQRLVDSYRPQLILYSRCWAVVATQHHI